MGAGALVAAAWEAYRLHPISFGVSTTYLRWDTAFPAVTVCQRNNRPRAYAYSERLFGAGRNPMVDELLNEMAFFPYSEAPYLVQLCGLGGRPPRMPCPQDGLREMAREIRSPCSEVLFSCWWKGQPFNCCQHFLPLETEMGLCFSLNNIHTRTPDETLRIVSNWRIGKGSLTVEMNADVIVVVQGPEELPSLGAERQALPWLRAGHVTLRRVAVREMSHAGGVAAVAPGLRRCRFPWEPLPGAPPGSSYSYGGCVAACRRARERELCGCYLHLAPVPDEGAPACDLRGVHCLLTRSAELLAQAPSPGHFGLFCDCPASCQEMAISTLYEDIIRRDELNGTNSASLTIQLDRLATERDHRLVVTGPLDVVGMAVYAVYRGIRHRRCLVPFYHLMSTIDLSVEYLKNYDKSRRSNSAIFLDTMKCSC